MQDQHKSVCLVTGMHRSGTSLLTSCLQAMNVAVPGPLIEGDVFNKDGYYENRYICEIQERLLIKLGRYWASDEGCLGLPQNWLQSESAIEASQMLEGFLVSAAKDITTIAIKDPRSSLLLPLWKDTCQRIGFDLRVMISVRHPLEVAASLVKRDAKAVGMTPVRALRLWLRHNRQILDDAMGTPHHVVMYDDWYKYPDEVIKGIACFCGINTKIEEVTTRVKQRISPELRCHRVSEDLNVNTPKEIGITLGTLQRMAEAGRSRHPWHSRAQRICKKPLQDIAMVRRWLEEGPNAEERKKLIEIGLEAEETEIRDDEQCAEIVLVGANMGEWWVHAALDKVGVARKNNHISNRKGYRVLIHVGVFDQENSWFELARLKERDIAIVESSDKKSLLRGMGIRAVCIHSISHNRNTWLAGINEDEASVQLGLPKPAALKQAIDILCIGKVEDELWLKNSMDGIGHLDASAMLTRGDEKRAQWLAKWLLECRRVGIRIAAINPHGNNRAYNSVKLLDRDAMTFFNPITPREVRAELFGINNEAGIKKGFLSQASTEVFTAWKHETGREPRGSIVISLYDYEESILNALESVRLQTEKDLELIVVNDGSSDRSGAVAMKWLQTNGNRFTRALLLEHQENAGLAAARNSGLKVASAQWCFILDADNTLRNRALEKCLILAEQSSEQVAVIHPIIEMVGQGMSRRLMGTMPWDEELLRKGNYIDAMALINKKAWEVVGGYRHIPGGWEDYDLWCLLHEHGYRGVLCPEILATYNVHDSSMLQTKSINSLRSLSRIMTRLHPWLQLPLAIPER